jgi:hypothetical protein
MAIEPATGGPIHLVQVTRHQQLLEQYNEYLPVAQRLQEELLETIDQLRELQGNGEENTGEKAVWDERTVAGTRAWAEDMGVPWRALRVSLYPSILSSLLTEYFLLYSAPDSGKTRHQNSS